MNNKNILIVVAVGAAFLVGGYYLGNRNSSITVNTTGTEISSNDENKGNNAEASLPLNSPNVPAVAKPVVKVQTAPSVVTNYLKIGQKTTINGVRITPIRISYDSRCPKDVKCIQAGSFELGVLLESGSLSQNVIITLGKPLAFAEKEITLTGVSPSKISTKTTLESEYRFTVTVK